MKELKWNITKNARLKRTRGASFEDIIKAKIIAVKEHPKKPHQGMLLFQFKKYIWVVPFVEDKNHIFLKTLYPSRKYTKVYREAVQ
jgi:hypothetical protein